MGSALEQSILRTLCWFSVLEYPATGFEVWKWLHTPTKHYSLEDVEEALRSSLFLGKVIERDGSFVWLKSRKVHEGQEMGVDGGGSKRRERYLDAMEKKKRLMWVVRYARWLPFVRGIAAANTLSYYFTRPQSDIDVFVVSKNGCVWLSRLFLVLPFAFLKLRPGTGKPSPLCFSFFSSERSLGLAHLRVRKDEPYLPFWIGSLWPLLDKDDVFLRLLSSNAWTRHLFPNMTGKQIHPRATNNTQTLWGHGNVRPDRFLSVCERLALFVQYKKLPQRIRARANQDTSVVLTRNMIKLHDTDARADFARQFTSLCHMFGI